LHASFVSENQVAGFGAGFVAALGIGLQVNFFASQSAFVNSRKPAPAQLFLPFIEPQALVLLQEFAPLQRPVGAPLVPVEGAVVFPSAQAEVAPIKPATAAPKNNCEVFIFLSSSRVCIFDKKK
jgi:hypothetical protein